MAKPAKKPPLPTLPAQLVLAMGTWLASPAALRHAKNASPRSKKGKSALPKRLEEAVAREAGSRAKTLLSGIERYMATPYVRRMPETPVVWKKGRARLLNYSLLPLGEGGAQRRMRALPAGEALTPAPLPEGEGIILFIPSLINRYYILDLKAESSLLRYLAGKGLHPLVLDWGAPGNAEKKFDSEDYIIKILLPVIDFIYESTGRKITLAGYCMGGVLATAAAQLNPHRVCALALLATPWDFHCKKFSPFVVDKKWRTIITSLLSKKSTVPADVIQSLFYMTDPWVFEQKFRRFAGLESGSVAAQDFVALERWVNDGVPMTTPLAKDCLVGWAQENKLVRGKWQVAGKKIDPRKINIPTFIAIPANDHVVPNDCALPLAQLMKKAAVIHPGAGHVGMIVGTKAKKELWQPLAKWLLHRSISARIC